MYVWGVVCTHVCIYEDKCQCCVTPSIMFHLIFLRRGLSLNLDLIILAGSAGHSDFRDLLVSPSKLWSYR